MLRVGALIQSFESHFDQSLKGIWREDALGLGEGTVGTLHTTKDYTHIYI